LDQQRDLVKLYIGYFNRAPEFDGLEYHKAAVLAQIAAGATFEEALYFALTTYTTLGFGDIVPTQDWRLLTGASSANGLLLFGLSAAVLVDATERLRQRG
ncbi:MAG: potassium channel family protein, partial [Pseudomonadota bacterium]